MNKKLLVVLSAVVFALTAGPATADVIYTPVEPFYDFGIGLYNPEDPGTLNTVYVTSNNNVLTSDVFQFTFAAHMNYIYYNAESLHFNFYYDNSSLEVVGARPVGVSQTGQPWPIVNYLDFQWPNPSSGIVSVSTLFQGFDPGGTNALSMPTSEIVPFFQVTLHVKRAVNSWVNVFGIDQMTLVSHPFNLTLFPENFRYFNGAIHESPEPGSMALLVCGLAALLGGTFVRRRRTA